MCSLLASPASVMCMAPPFPDVVLHFVKEEREVDNCTIFRVWLSPSVARMTEPPSTEVRERLANVQPFSSASAPDVTMIIGADIVTRESGARIALESVSEPAVTEKMEDARADPVRGISRENVMEVNATDVAEQM